MEASHIPHQVAHVFAEFVHVFKPLFRVVHVVHYSHPRFHYFSASTEDVVNAAFNVDEEAISIARGATLAIVDEVEVERLDLAPVDVVEEAGEFSDEAEHLFPFAFFKEMNDLFNLVNYVVLKTAFRELHARLAVEALSVASKEALGGLSHDDSDLLIVGREALNLSSRHRDQTSKQ